MWAPRRALQRGFVRFRFLAIHRSLGWPAHAGYP